MDKMQIADLSAATGFSTATLRYYEQVGLLDPAERSPSGYRLYGPREVERVLFIGRAKRLGLSLEDIRSLVGVWAGGECAVTRQQLRGLVKMKIDAVRRQVDEATTFLAQLEAVDERLAELLTSENTGTGCDCAPELPHLELVHVESRLADPAP